MSDRKTSITPIIVGVVIALLGILTGLYIATNAREQLEAQNQNVSPATENMQATDAQPATEQATLPDLPEIEGTPAPIAEEPIEVEVVEEPVIPEVPNVEETPKVTTVETEQGEPDDFVPVSPEEIEKALP